MVLAIAHWEGEEVNKGLKGDKDVMEIQVRAEERG